MGKLAGHTSLTNFFMSQRSVERAISKGRFFGIAEPGGSLLCRRDRDFHHLYVHFSSPEVLISLLDAVSLKTPFVADIIKRGNTHEELVALLSNSGFTTHRILDRLNRPQQGLPEPPQKTMIQNASPGDADEILNNLESFFDRFSEQLPELDDIAEAIANKYVIVSRLEDQLAGFLFFEPSGRNSILRYWFVNPKFQNMSVGSSLIRHYLSMSFPNTLSQLWVVNDNYNAINKYHHYGYRNDVLSDQIMIRK